MADNSTNFERMSFLEMLEQHPIEIPMIQRDYAQGRESQKKLFQNFLKALKIAVCESPIELDFVYGDIKNNKFHPLDGQQRLTTLFLLHWYAAACSNSPKDNARILCRFTYCTRISSRSFCEQILKNIDEYKPSKLTPSKWIEDQSWFRAAWKKDPTVSGMISALNSIQEQFGDINDELWGKLNKHTEPSISFHKTVLDSIGLSDDLYIKMNARGKALSSFENLKAQVDRKIEKEQWEKDVPHVLKFNYLVDTEWTNLIWKSFGKEKFDLSFIRVFANIAVYAIINDTENDYPARNGNPSIKDSLESVIDQLVKDSTNLSIEHISRKVYEVLYGSFRGLCQLNEKQLVVDGFSWFEMPASIDGKTISIFECIGEPKLNPTMQQRLLCFAIYEYAQKNHNDIIEEKYYIWLRFVRNIIQNSNIDSLERFISAARFIHKMAEGCGDIYTFIDKSTYEDRGFGSEAVKREKKKAEMISADRDFMEILHCLEDTKFCYGNLTFPFKYISNTTEVSSQKVRLKHVLRTIEEYFSEGISDLHRRALLTVGDGSYYKYWWSWLYAADGNKHRLLMNIGDLRDNISRDELLNSFSAYFDLLNTQTPDQLIAAFDHSDKEHWRYKLIKDPALLQKSTYKYFTFSSDGKCYLIPRSKVENSNEGKRRLIEVGIHSYKRSRAQGCLLGQLAGDALGSLVEFQSPDEIRRSYPDGVRELADGGTWNTIAGQPTDDSEMALLLARMLVKTGLYDPEAARKEYQYWLSSDPFDCGMTISAGLRGNPNPDSQANGAMMRICPLGIFGAGFELNQVAEWAMQDAALTHPNLICQQANALFAMGIAHAIQSGCDRKALYQHIRQWAVDMPVEPALLETIDKAADERPADYVHQQGWVLIAFQNALYQLLHAPSLEEGVVNTIMRGGDTDTNAAICGALLGAVCGREAIPAQWLDCLQNCRPEAGHPGVNRPRPECFWPVDALELAEGLIGRQGALP